MCRIIPVNDDGRERSPRGRGHSFPEGRPRVEREVLRDAVREVLLEIPGFRALAERGIAEGVMSDPPSSAGTDRAMVGGSETLATAVAPGGSGSSSAEERPPGKTA